MIGQSTWRESIEATVAERARHETADQVQNTCSFARAERLLGREYHGRFLIELLQNAADAWRKARSSGDERSRLSILVTEGPALVVANQGLEFPPNVVLESLGHVGRSTKAHGEAIGHKGIGFKSVLEVSQRPELYSGLSSNGSGLSVCFDPRVALEQIRAASPSWDAFIADIEDMRERELAPVPVLRFPRWVDAPPDVVRELADVGFDTVVRLPFDAGLELGAGEEEWLRLVRDGLRDVTDEILVLLGTFDEVRIEDRVAGRALEVRPVWRERSALGEGITREAVDVSRGGSKTSRWRLYRRTLPRGEDLAAEIAIGLRTSGGATPGLLPAVDNQPSAPFHLFFPTAIASGLPLLVHGYFEVNAARTGFYEGSAGRNRDLLGALAELVATAVEDIASAGSLDLAPLADLLGEASLPDDPAARAFYEGTLELLDAVDWVPLEEPGSARPRARPTQLLTDGDLEILDQINAAFPAPYVRARTGLGVPAARIGFDGRTFLASRRPKDAPELLHTVGVLCRPGDESPWPGGEEDERFVAVIELFAALRVKDAEQTNQLLAKLRGDPRSRLVPAAKGPTERVLLPIPDPDESAPGRRSDLAMARLRQAGAPLTPPDALGLAFLRDGLLDVERLDRARPLGVRPFTVDTVLDRLAGPAAADTPAAELVAFLWALLVRERRSEFGTRASAERALTFDPAGWFWCLPDDGGGDALERTQRRARHLAGVQLPARDGDWRPAGTLAFGADWAEWLESGCCGPPTAATVTRAGLYRFLEVLAPGPGDLLASPADLLPYLRDGAFRGDVRDDAEDAEEDLDSVGDDQRNRERHAFLLRLGVWESIPLEGFRDRTRRDREPFPWPGPLDDLRRRQVQEAGGWGFEGFPDHRSVWVAEDSKLLWPLGDLGRRDPTALARVLSAGSGLYGQLKKVSVFCSECTGRPDGRWHKARYSSRRTDPYPSTLALQLQSEAWVPAVMGGERQPELETPDVVWWSAEVPEGAGMRQSPLRFLRLADPALELAPELRRLAKFGELEQVSADGALDLLGDLRERFDRGILSADPRSDSSAKVAFVGVHRRLYERLADVTPAEGLDPAHRAQLEKIGVLCDLGPGLAWCPPADARYDDGEFAAYRRYFTAQVPFVVLARHRLQARVAERLGVPRFSVSIERRVSGPARDVTADLEDLLADRVGELLALLVHHSLAGQPLDPASRQFEERARRLARLRVLQVDDLVVDARVDDLAASASIGEGTDQDVILEDATGRHPVLYCDFAGEGWKDRLRRKLAGPIARILENPAHEDVFALFLLTDGDGEREAALLERGISIEDVEDIRRRIGAVSERARRSCQLWVGALVATLQDVANVAPVPLDRAAAKLRSAGVAEAAAERLTELSSADDVSRDVSAGGALWLLHELGVDLAGFDRRLRDAGEPGLEIRVAQRRLSEWTGRHARQTAAVLAKRLTLTQAKAEPQRWRPAERLDHELDPEPEQWLGPVLASLRAAGLDPDAQDLAGAAEDELIRLGELAGAPELYDRVARLYDPEEQERVLREHAGRWRAAIVFLGVLARTSDHDGPAAIRARKDEVERSVPVGPPAPSELRAVVSEVFAQHPALVAALGERLVDSLGVTSPEPRALVDLARRHGMPVDHVDSVERVLAASRRVGARRVEEHVEALKRAGLSVQPPAGLVAPAPARPKPSGGIKRVAKVTVGPSVDRRKRQRGDEGEAWALAGLIAPLLKLEAQERRAAIDDLVSFVQREFEGTPVDAALGHADRARMLVDGDELIDALTGLLHVARHSDAFGFDVLAWVPTAAGATPSPTCVEVKSSSNATFHVSQAEWVLASKFADRGEGHRYAILAVRRSATGGPPEALHLLPDPVGLTHAGVLLRRADGYHIVYEPT